jgi:cupin fold WbuC family metalloprotein
MSSMKAFKEESKEVLYPQEDVVLLKSTDMVELKRLALLNPRKRVRICSHRSPGDALHEMFIVHTCDTYVRPHKHIDKAESFFILEGRVDVVLLQDDGKIREVIPMGAPESSLAFYYRLADPIFHTLLIRSDVLVFHEVTQGPFKREQTVFAEWAPADFDAGTLRGLDPAVAIERLRHQPA